MKKIINGKMYNTETATEINFNQYSNRTDFSFWCETLYQKKTGEYFLHGEGGAQSKYGRKCGQNEWCGGETIIPMTESEAKQWAEDNLTADEYIAAFGEPEE